MATESPSLKKVVKKHPLAIRWFHWINFPVLTVMIWSGLLIYWANDVYRLGWGDTTILKFFPKSFYEALSVPFKLAQGMAFHFFFMWLFFINGTVYVLYTVFSGEWRYLLPNRHSFKEAWHVVLHDLHIRKEAPPQEKYNAAQRIAYSAIIVMGLGSLVTGLAIYKPIQFGWLCNLCGGYSFARIIHFALTIGYCLFFVVHIVQVVLAGWNNFQAMVTGIELVKGKAIAAIVPITETVVEAAPEDELHQPEGMETAVIHPEGITEELPEEEKDTDTQNNEAINE
jgi:thiosulfate reductase cytochrome b subunit